MSALPNLSIPVGKYVCQPSESDSTRLAHRRLRSSVAVISARGHIDASNADTLTGYTVEHLTGCRGLILDLRNLDFFGTQGFSTLHRVSVHCAHAGRGWAIVPSEAVSRVLRIGDPHGLLPAARTVEAALAIIHDEPHHPPQASGAAEKLDNPRHASARCA